MVTSLCDLVKTVMDWIKDSDNVPNYQLISPIILLISTVSGRACICGCCSFLLDICMCQYKFHIAFYIDTDDSSDNK